MVHLLALLLAQSFGGFFPSYPIPMPCAQGGTGLTSFTIGDLIVANGTCGFAKLSDVATGQVLASGGVGASPAFTGSPSFSGLVTFNNFNTFKTDASGTSANVFTYGTVGTTLNVKWRQAADGLGSGYMTLWDSGVTNTVNGVAANLMRLGYATGGTFTSPTGQTFSLAVDESGNVGAAGYLAATTGVKTNGTDYAPPMMAADGTALASTYHCVGTASAGLIASGVSTSVTFTNAAIFAGNLTLSIEDDTALSIPTVTAQSSSGFTFTSINGHVYSYRACGE